MLENLASAAEKTGVGSPDMVLCERSDVDGRICTWTGRTCDLMECMCLATRTSNGESLSGGSEWAAMLWRTTATCASNQMAPSCTGPLPRFDYAHGVHALTVLPQ
jgi:hypothetical protein